MSEETMTITPSLHNFPVCWIYLNTGYVYIGKVKSICFDGENLKLELSSQVEVRDEGENGWRTLDSPKKYGYEFSECHLERFSDKEAFLSCQQGDRIKLCCDDEDKKLLCKLLGS